MRPWTLRLILALVAWAVAAAPPATAAAPDPEYSRMGPDIFDVRADGPTQVAAALARASVEKNG